MKVTLSAVIGKMIRAYSLQHTGECSLVAKHMILLSQKTSRTLACIVNAKGTPLVSNKDASLRKTFCRLGATTIEKMAVPQEKRPLWTVCDLARQLQAGNIPIQLVT